VVERERRVVAEGVPAFGVGQRAVETSSRRPYPFVLDPRRPEGCEQGVEQGLVGRRVGDVGDDGGNPVP
jgi:hypothetical protein